MLLAAFVAATFASSASAEADRYRFNIAGHVWTVTPVYLGNTETIFVVQDSRNIPQSKKYAFAIARTYAGQHLGGCTVRKMIALGKSGWRVDFNCKR